MGILLPHPYGTGNRSLYSVSYSMSRIQDSYRAIYDTAEYYCIYGLRPVVCLNSNTQLEKQADGTYRII